MQPKISLKLEFFIVSIVGIAFSSAIIFFLTFDLPVQGSSPLPPSPAERETSQNLASGEPTESLQTAALKKQMNLGLPIRLTIPKIKVDTALEHVGLTSAGAVDVPKGPVNAAWYKLGPRPGEIGNAVITGHYGVWKNGTPTVFNNLYKLRKGDKLYVKDGKGAITTFVVRELRTYDPKANASDVFISTDGKAHLNLITCGGAWNKISKSYPRRLVVFTDKEIKNDELSYEKPFKYILAGNQTIATVTLVTVSAPRH